MSAPRAYLDAGGAAPLSQRVRDALTSGFAQAWADPAGLTAPSRQARAVLDGAREAIADVLGVRPEGVHFAASPQDALHRVVAGIHAARRGRHRIAVTAVERDATLHAAEFAAPQQVDVMSVNAEGHVALDAVAAAASSVDTSVMAIQHANHELGTIQDLGAIAALAGGSGVPLVVDATSSVGHIDPPAHWDALVAHPADWGGPAGIGVLALKPHTRWLSAWPEGEDWAPGGVSVPLALASAVALQEREENRADEAERLFKLVKRLRAGVGALDGVDVVGDPIRRLPHVLTFSCLYANGEALVSRLDREGFAVGSGSACASGTLEPSRVLGAIGALTHGNVRVALHPGVGEKDIDRFLAVLPTALSDVRDQLGAPPL